MTKILKRTIQSVKWRLGLPVAAAALEIGTDEAVADFYNNRVTECTFLDDPSHYEHPRVQWVLNQITDGTLLEIGCGNGGMTKLLAPKVKHLTAFDVSAPSLKQVEDLGLPNVSTAQGLIEDFKPENQFDQIVLSEVIEHLREPLAAMRRCFEWLAPNGLLLITTPNGHWESDEHLQEFSLESFSRILAGTNCESFQTGYLRDRDNRRRWLTAILKSPQTPAAPNNFFNRQAVAKLRKVKK